MKNFLKLMMVFTLLTDSLNTSRAQSPSREEQTGKAAKIKSLIQNKNFVFKLNPSDTTEHSRRRLYVAVSSDTLVVRLPALAKTDSIKLNSTGFTYHAVQNKNGNWEITIRPGSNVSDVRELTLTVKPTGHASLHVIRGHLDPISWEGYIKQEDY